MGRVLDIGEIDYIFPSPTPCKLYGTVRGCSFALPEPPDLPTPGLSFQRITVAYSGYCVNIDGEDTRTLEFSGSHLLDRAIGPTPLDPSEFQIVPSPGSVSIFDGGLVSGSGVYHDGVESVPVTIVSQLNSFPLAPNYSAENLTFTSTPTASPEIPAMKGLLMGLVDSLDLWEGRGAWCFTFQGEVDGVKVDAKYEGVILLSPPS